LGFDNESDLGIALSLELLYADDWINFKKLGRTILRGLGICTGVCTGSCTGSASTNDNEIERCIIGCVGVGGERCVDFALYNLRNIYNHQTNNCTHLNLR